MLQCFCGQRSKSTTITNGEKQTATSRYGYLCTASLFKRNITGGLEGLKGWEEGVSVCLCACVCFWPSLCVSKKKKSCESAVRREPLLAVPLPGSIQHSSEGASAHFTHTELYFADAPMLHRRERKNKHTNQKHTQCGDRVPELQGPLRGSAASGPHNKAARFSTADSVTAGGLLTSNRFVSKLNKTSPWL